MLPPGLSAHRPRSRAREEADTDSRQADATDRQADTRDHDWNGGTADT